MGGDYLHATIQACAILALPILLAIEVLDVNSGVDIRPEHETLELGADNLAWRWKTTGARRWPMKLRLPFPGQRRLMANWTAIL